MNIRSILRSGIRLLRLVLVSALIFSLGTAVFAAGFTDGDRIGSAYRVAVEQMTERGVLNGFPDGSFQPEGTLTREQGAKIVTYMILGDMADYLTCFEAPFDDVAAERWSAPCIAWCVEREILLGYGDGRFGPDDTLTGDQFSKMLLCAFTLSREGNYKGLGNVWFEAVREDARAVKLYEGDVTMASDEPILRQQAALLAWNAVQAADAGGTPADPADPAIPESPVIPESPAVPEDLQIPADPDFPEVPELPSDDPIPDPEVPKDPETPSEGSGGEGEVPDIPTDPTAPSDDAGDAVDQPEIEDESGTEDPGQDPDPAHQLGSSGGDNGDIQLPEVP